MNVHHDPESARYVLLDDDGQFAGEVEYEQAGDSLLLIRAEVPPERRGGGVGVRLVQGTLDLIAAEGRGPIRPICPFIAKFIAKNPQYQSLLG